MEQTYLTSFAYAKINLALAITGVREDGYHELQSVMQSIDLHDVVKVRLGGEKVVCRCGELSGPGNLAHKAALFFQEKYGQFEGIEIEIEKNIPVQAGLAGGSADAAATIRLLNQLYGNPFDNEELISIANRCGADVAFCLYGGTMWASGRGEQLELLPSAPPMDLVLVKPSEGVNTREAYQLFDKVGRSSFLNRANWVSALGQESTEEIVNLLSNDLESASMQLVPEIWRLKELLVEADCQGALMSGSGSSVFGIAQGRAHAEKVAGKLRVMGYNNIWLTKMVSKVID